VLANVTTPAAEPAKTVKVEGVKDYGWFKSEKARLTSLLAEIRKAEAKKPARAVSRKEKQDYYDFLAEENKVPGMKQIFNEKVWPYNEAVKAAKSGEKKFPLTPEQIGSLKPLPEFSISETTGIKVGGRPF